MTSCSFVALCRDDLLAKNTPAERGSVDEAPEETVELALKKWELLEDNPLIYETSSSTETNELFTLSSGDNSLSR